jgi:drug/metabolite transporter (DMT)-like permease
METKTKAIIALLIVCIFWGTTYLALRIGVETFPAFLFSAIRQISAGVLLLALLFIFKKTEKVNFSDIIKQVIPGILLITLGNGIVGWAELYIPSGLAALIISVMPIFLVIINVISGKEQKQFNFKIILGFILGCTGIVLIFKDNLADLAKSEYMWGVLAVFGASIFWALGSVYMKHTTFNTNPYTNATIQFISGGLGLLLFSLIFDDYSQLSAVTSDSLWALLYLILIGSLLSYLSYLYAIKHLPIVMVSTYAYVNPIIAILLGVIILNEKITWITVLALVTTLYGVYLINSGYRTAVLKVKKTIKAIVN